MNKDEQRTLAAKLAHAAQLIKDSPKAEYIFLKEEALENICWLHGISKEEAMKMLEKLFNPKK